MLEETIKPEENSLDKAVNAGIKAQEETKPEEKSEEKTSEEVTEVKSDELSEDETQVAKDLFKALKDPEAAKIVIETLAKSAGIKIAEIETKKEEKAAIKSIKDTVIAELGEDYKFLADKLGSVMEKVVNEAIDNKTKDIKATLEANAKNEQKKALGEALDFAWSGYQNVDTKIQNKVYELAEEIHPKEGSDPAKYFDRLTKLAAEELGVTLIKKESKSINQQDRRDSNRRDSQNRISQEDKADEKITNALSNKPTLDEAIRRGMANAEKELQKR